MRPQSLGLAVVAVVVTGCGLTAPVPNETPVESGSITIADKSRATRSVECTQQEWNMMIEADSEAGRAQVYLELGGPAPVVRTVTIENIDGLNAVSGGDVAEATASTDGDVYTVTGTAVGSHVSEPGQTRPMPFEITAPC